MHPDRDFDLAGELPPFWEDLEQDLALHVLLGAMAGNDAFLLKVARAAISSGIRNDAETIQYRQDIVQDCIANAAAIRDLYAITVEAAEQRRQTYMGIFGRYPAGILSGALNLLELFTTVLGKLRVVADNHAATVSSKGLTTLFTMLRSEFSDEYLNTVRAHLKTLKFRKGILLSAALGPGNQGTGYMLHEGESKMPGWLSRVTGTGPLLYTFRIHSRDDAGARALSEIHDRGINHVANATAQSADHIESFFNMLRTELAFYVCCLNLHDRLAAMNASVSLPQAHASGTRVFHFSGLYDPTLALSMGSAVVSNSIDADDKSLLVITGANQGGKTSFIRSVGVAQLMMQCGMFVSANSSEAALCTGIFTHYKREEDPTMRHGKLDEELNRLSNLVDVINPNALLLFNESFAATNEREGSEIARQVVSALLEKGVKILFVTHLYEFAHRALTDPMTDTLFLRAERRADGTRTFRMLPKEPLETSYAADVYRIVFGETE